MARQFTAPRSRRDGSRSHLLNEEILELSVGISTEWCGLLFAGTTDGAGYVIPAQAVVDDVQGHHWVHFGVAIAGVGTRLVIEEK